MTRSNKSLKSKPKPKKLVDGQLAKALAKQQQRGRRSNRVRVQAVLHQVPVPVVQKKPKRKQPVDVNNKNRNTKRQKNDKNKVGKIGKGVTKGKKEKKEKVKKEGKKGNDRLVPRDGVPQYTENPFFTDAKTPEYVSSHVHYRWLIRALRRGSLNEVKEFVKSKNAVTLCADTTFAYNFNRSACLEAYLVKDQKLTTEFFKLKHEVESRQSRGRMEMAEPNLLQLKSSGRKNYHMIGRATRHVEMARGGKEGNNALLNYANRDRVSELQYLVENNTPYTKIYQFSKIQHGNISEMQLESQVVTAARMGHRELASSFAEGPARNHMNDLHRQTLKNDKLPEKILAISAVKKGFMNRNITPIHTAAICKNPKLLEDLRVVYPNLNIPDQDNWYTIHYAAVCEGPEPLKFLLKNGGSVTSLTKKQQTPLHVAVRAGRAENAKIILNEMLELEKGPDGELVGKPDRSMVNSRTRTGVAAIHIAAINNKLEVVDALLSSPTVLVNLPTSTTTNRVTPLMLACGWGHLAMAEKLISQGALIEGKDKKKRTPLIYAMMNGQTHVAAMLLAKGAVVSAADSSGNTSAHYAAAYGFMDSLKLLASVDADILAVENDWMLLPMSIAYLKGHYGIVAWLFDGPYKDKANINAKDNTGATLLSSLLFYADESYHKQLDTQIEYLTKRGANSGIEDSNGQTALHHFAAMRVVLKGSGEAAEVDATRMDLKQYKKCFEMLLAAGGNVEAKDNQDNTPLHLALSSGNLFLFKLMFEKVENRKELFETWAPNQNILHQILGFPMMVYKDATLWKGEKLNKMSYHVLPILRDLRNSLEENFKLWINEVNKDGYTPMHAALKEYAIMPANVTPQFGTNNEFIATVCELFEWVLRLDEEQITKKVENPKLEIPPTSLAVMAMNIQIETAGNRPENHLAFFKILIKLAREFNKLSELLQFTNELDDSLIIVAITNGYSNVVELLLDTATDNGLIHHNVHNAVKKFEIKFGEKKEVNKTILMYLIERGMSDFVEKVNATSEFWNRVDAEGNNVWNYAARINNHKTVSLFKLIEQKGVKRVANAKKRTPLHEATLACEGSANSVLEPIAWLSTKTDVGSLDMYNRTALHYAFGNEKDFEKKNSIGSEIDPIAVVSLLSSSMSVPQLNIADVDGNTVAHLAALRNSTICLMTLIRKNCEIEITNKDGNTPLALAVYFGRQSSALTLIQANADVTGNIYHRVDKEEKKKDDEEWLWRGRPVKKIQFGESDVNTTIPAQVVSHGGRWEAMVYVLLDVLGQNTNSMAQLTDAAIKKGHYNLANQLLKTLEALLDGNVLRTEYDLLNTFAGLCFGRLQGESIEKIVLDRICRLRGMRLTLDSVSNVIETALKCGNWNMLQFLKKELKNEWVNMKTTSPSSSPIRSLLIYMVEMSMSNEAQEMLKELIKMKGLNINTLFELEVPAQYKTVGLEIGDLTPISWAVLRGKDDLILFLRQCGANLKTTDDFGRTPLMYAIMTNRRNAIVAIVGDGKRTVVIPKKPETTFNGNGKKRAVLLFGQAAKSTAMESQPAVEDSEESEDGSSAAESDSESENDSDDASDAPPAKKKRTGGDYEATESMTIGLGNEDRVKIVITDPSIFAQIDKSGRNALHYLIEPLSWENVELLVDLAAANKKLIVEMLISKHNPNPVELAAQKINRRLLKQMLTIVKGSSLPRPIKEVALVLDPVVSKPLSDVDKDCREFLTEWAREHDKKKAAEVPKPHNNSTYQTTGNLVYCDETSQYFDVLLNKTDLNYGRYGFHNFYRMQLIKRKDCELYVLFTNWGRIGDGVGEFQTTPFNSLEAGKKEFKSIWKSKSGNEWVPLDDFVEQPKKYRLVKSDTVPESLAGVELPEWKKNKDEKDPVRRFMADISDPKKLKEYSEQMTIHGTRIRQPFGRFTRENIEKARKVLDKLKLNAEKIQKLMARTPIIESELRNAYMNTNDLSGEYYSLIPTGEFEFSSLTRLDSLDDIERHRQKLNRYEEIETATRLLCGAARRPEIDRIEYIQSAIETNFRVERPDSEKSQQILQWVYNTSLKEKQTKVRMILEVFPKDATEKFIPFLKDENQKLLFHGTRATNLLSILRNGFLVDPPSACRNGNLFGSGIYLSDCFEKSSHYCVESADGVKYMMICQAALGGVRQISEIPYNFGTTEKRSELWEDTLHYVGDKNPAGSLTFDGVAIPLLPLVKRKEVSGNGFMSRSLDYAEYIVRNQDRVLPRFIVVFDSK